MTLEVIRVRQDSEFVRSGEGSDHADYDTKDLGRIYVVDLPPLGKASNRTRPCSG